MNGRAARCVSAEYAHCTSLPANRNNMRQLFQSSENLHFTWMYHDHELLKFICVFYCVHFSDTHTVATIHVCRWYSCWSHCLCVHELHIYLHPFFDALSNSIVFRAFVQRQRGTILTNGAACLEYRTYIFTTCAWNVLAEVWRRRRVSCADSASEMHAMEWCSVGRG